MLVKNRYKPKTKKNMIKDANEAGYVVDEDYLTGTSKIYTLSDNLEVEFLINQMGSVQQTVIKTNIGINADALRHLSILNKYVVQLNITDYQVSVPIPEAYTLHKMIINSKRGKKQEKDKEAILNIIPYLEFEKIKTMLLGLSKKETKNVINFLNKHPELEDFKEQLFSKNTD